jgi:dihydroxy-acid dehydratase
MDPKARRLGALAAQIVQADDEAVEVSAVPDLEDLPDLASCAACPAHNGGHDGHDGHDGAVTAAAGGKCPSHHDGGGDECAVHAARRTRRAPPVFSSTAARERASAVAAAMAAGRPPPPRGLERKLANYGDAGFSVFLRKAFIKAMGYTDDALTRPIVGITNTYSGYNACHRTVPDLIDAIKRGVTAAGGLPIEFPIVSIHEAFTSPTSMFLRNLMAMDCEELVRAQPMDAVVLIGGCDKTVPALLMGAASVNVPAVMTVTGPMLTGNWNGEELGACTDCRRLWGLHRGDELTLEEVEEAGNFLMPSAGTCQVMGTASTMALMAEAIGMMLPGGASIPAVHADRLRHAELSGARAVELARLATQDAEDTVMSSATDAKKEEGTAGPIAPTEIMTQKSMENALRILLAVGGSTNGLVHIAAIAGRLGLRVDLEMFDRMGRETPVLVDL